MPAKRTQIATNVATTDQVSGPCRSVDGSLLALLSTSSLMRLIEEVCVEAMRERIEADQCSVGGITHLRQLAPVLLPKDVMVTAIFRLFDGEFYWFDVLAVDGVGPVASASHARSVVDISGVEKQVLTDCNT